MSNYQWYITSTRRKILEEIKEIPEYGKMKVSNLMELALKEFILKHGKSSNPQTTITLFLNQNVMAIPNVYASPEDWYRFYEIVRKDKEVFLELEGQLQKINRIHEAFATTYGMRL